jgi:purine-binding chemotaxis protein CheW
VFIHLLYLTTKNHYFCLPLEEVDRLLLLMEIQTIPQAPDYLVGLMNLYGEAIPVIDLALRIGLNHNEPYSLDTPLVLVKHGQQKAALIIDNIEGVKKVNRDQLRGEKLFEGGSPPVKATITTEQETALLLDTHRLLDIDLNSMGIQLVLDEKLLSLCHIEKELVNQSRTEAHG